MVSKPVSRPDVLEERHRDTIEAQEIDVDVVERDLRLGLARAILKQNWK
jgi:hypothetical protein